MPRVSITASKSSIAPFVPIYPEKDKAKSIEYRFAAWTLDPKTADVMRVFRALIVSHATSEESDGCNSRHEKVIKLRIL